MGSQGLEVSASLNTSIKSEYVQDRDPQTIKFNMKDSPSLGTQTEYTYEPTGNYFPLWRG